MSNPILCDMHTHSSNSHDGRSSVFEMAQTAIERGVGVFAVTDHCDCQFFYDHHTQNRIRQSNLDAKEAARAFAGKVKVLAGIEVGEALWYPKRMQEILKENEYDVIIASVHSIRFEGDETSTASRDFSDYDDEAANRYIAAYYHDVFQTLLLVPCDLAAHLSYPFRYLRGKYGKKVKIENFEAQLRKILQYMIERGIALEINTSYWGPPYDTSLEDRFLLSLYRSMGGERVTLGSDAHVTDRLGKDFDSAIALLKEYGLAHYYYFEKRRPVPILL